MVSLVVASQLSASRHSLGEISVEMVHDMETTDSDLAELEIQLETQKETIQKQIVNACDASERSSSSLAEIEQQEVADHPPPSPISSLFSLCLTLANLVRKSGSIGSLGGQVAEPHPRHLTRSAGR
jgi:hypothetical protein